MITRIRRTGIYYKRNALLILLALCLLVTGCSKQYQAEKAFYWASKYSQDIFKDIKNIPSYKFDKALSNFQEIIEKYPQTVQAKESYFSIGKLYIVKENYIEAITVFQNFLAKYADQKEFSARAIMAIGGCYEKENDWESANRKYREAFSKYPQFRDSLKLPLHILDHFLAKKNKADITGAYQQAVQDYKNILSRYPDTQLSYAANNLLVEAHMRTANWAEMLSTLNGMVKKYPQSSEVPTWLMTMAATYEMKLNDRTKAIGLYQTIVDKYKKSPWAEEAGKRLSKLATARK